MADGSAKQFTNKVINIQLDDTNYLQWRQQIEFTIASHRLESHIDGSDPPLEFITGADGARIPNPRYTDYKSVDSALASWLLSSISHSLLPNLVRCRTAREIWIVLQRLFSVASTTRIMRLFCSLQSQKKRDLLMRDYLSRIQLLCDSLESSGHKIPEPMQIATILAGLPAEYEHVVALIAARDHPFDLQAVTDILLDSEARHQDALSQLAPFTLNNTALNTMVSNTSSFGNQQHYQSATLPSAPHQPQFHGQGRGRGNGNRIQCQLCGRFGHPVQRCWYRFDPNFQGTQSSSQSSGAPSQSTQQESHRRSAPSGSSSQSSSAGSSITANMAEFHPYRDVIHPVYEASALFPPPRTSTSGILPSPTGAQTVIHQYTSPATHPHMYGPEATVPPPSVQSHVVNPQANIASTSTSTPTADLNWYPDSGATNHLTNSVATMSNSNAYNGSGYGDGPNTSGGM